MNPQQWAARVAVGAVTAILSLLALTAMHVLPMAAASGTHTPAMEASAAMQDGLGDAMPTSPTVDAMQTSPTDDIAAHNTNGVPAHGHTLLHLCVAVLAAALLLLLIAVLRQRPWTQLPHLRVPQLRALLARDFEPPSLAGLCLLRC